MKKKVQVVTLVASMLVALHIFGNDSLELSFSQLYIGITAMVVAFADIIMLYGVEEKK